MKIIEDCTGSFICPKNINYLSAKRQLTSLPRVRVFDIYFSNKKRIKRKVIKLDKLKCIKPGPLSKKLDLCFGKWKSNCFKREYTIPDNDSRLPEIDNYTCVVDESNTRIILRKEAHKMDGKKSKYSMYLKKNKEGGGERDLSLASTANQSLEEDALTRNLTERLRERKRAARNSIETLENMERSKSDEHPACKVSCFSEKRSPDTTCPFDSNESFPRAAPSFESSQFRRNPFDYSGNIADGKLRFQSFKDTQEESLNLDALVERFLKNSDGPNAETVNRLKEGICVGWLKDDFTCMTDHCKYEHNVQKMFNQKLQEMPSLKVIQTIMSMKDDVLFTDALTEGFNVLRNRENFSMHLPFVAFFAFFVSGPNSSVLLPFWKVAAEYFIKSSHGPTDAFAQLFTVFGRIDRSCQPKLVNFIKILTKSPFNLEVDWKLLEPVIAISRVPTNLLVDAVRACNKSKLYIREIVDEIIPRIVVNNLSLDEMEVLLQFCSTLKDAGEVESLAALKSRLRSKVQNLSVIDQNLYPKTCLFHREINDIGEEAECKSSIKMENIKINPFHFTQHKIKLEQREKTVRVENLLEKVVDDISAFQFGSAGRTLNRFRVENSLCAAQKIAETVFIFADRPEVVLKFFLEASSNCSAKNSRMIISSVAMTVIVFVLEAQSNWSTAHAIYKVCAEQELDVSCGEVLSTSQTEVKSLRSKSNKVLLLLEICINAEKLEDAYGLIEKFDLCSSNLEDSTLEFDCKGDKLRRSLLADFMSKVKEAGLTELLPKYYNQYLPFSGWDR